MRLFCMSLFFSSFDNNFVIVVSKEVLFSATSCSRWIVNWPIDLPSCFYFLEYFQITLAMRYSCFKWMLPKLRFILHHVIKSKRERKRERKIENKREQQTDSSTGNRDFDYAVRHCCFDPHCILAIIQNVFRIVITFPTMKVKKSEAIYYW